MQMTVDEWRQLLLKFGIQAPSEDLEWLARTSATSMLEMRPRLATEPQLVQAPQTWERRP
jgi:hypothetical protein